MDVPSLEQNKMAASETKGGGRVNEEGMEERGGHQADVALQLQKSVLSCVGCMKIKYTFITLYKHT